ncbi:MAG: hypothetical protein H7Y18_10050 [Clostridiaceae bacterium]|nr:hypothetical protein [Clostridiaceae bacterium]
MRKKLTFLSLMAILIVFTCGIKTYVDSRNPFVGKWKAIGSSNKEINDSYTKNKYYTTFHKDNTNINEYITEGLKVSQKYYYISNIIAFDTDGSKESFTYKFKDKKHLSIISKNETGEISTEYEKIK